MKEKELIALFMLFNMMLGVVNLSNNKYLICKIGAAAAFIVVGAMLEKLLNS